MNRRWHSVNILITKQKFNKERMTASICNSIQRFGEFGLKKIEEKIKNVIIEWNDLADLVFGLQEDIPGWGDHFNCFSYFVIM